MSREVFLFTLAGVCYFEIRLLSFLVSFLGADARFSVEWREGVLILPGRELPTCLFAKISKTKLRGIE